MYAIVASRGHDSPALLLGYARTLSAAQKKWRKLFQEDNGYRCFGLLTSEGLVNYYGKPVKPDYNGFAVGCTLGGGNRP